MKSIFASKLYKASKRQDRIRSAMTDPINSELVQQLKSYIDDEYLEEAEPKDIDPMEGKGAENEDSGGSVSKKPSGGGGHHSSGGGGLGGGLPGAFGGDDDLGGDLGDMDSYSEDGGEEGPAPDVPDEPEGDVEEAVDINKVSEEDTIYAKLDIVRDTNRVLNDLNEDSLTSGVRRLSVKGKEAWIFYKDDVNLNDIMEPVISKIADICEDNLSFNRLARTENAIIFEIEDDSIVHYSGEDAVSDDE